MRIQWMLGWALGETTRRDFKSESAYGLFSEYLKRCSYFVDCGVSGLKKELTKNSQRRLWICDTSKKAIMLSSGQLAKEIEKLQLSGVKELVIFIGGPDGLAPESEFYKTADLLWNFGPMTLPHELAAVVASEQIYRAFTILKRLPYHSGH